MVVVVVVLVNMCVATRLWYILHKVYTLTYGTNWIYTGFIREHELIHGYLYVQRTDVCKYTVTIDGYLSLD